MSAGLIILIVVLGAALIGAGRWAWCRRHPAPLRGDWWPDFERDFRRWAASRPPREHRRRPSRRDTR